MVVSQLFYCFIADFHGFCGEFPCMLIAEIRFEAK